jgi:hypothetical protein
MRIDWGPGYRVYFLPHGKTVVVLLCGGDKRTQSNDIRRAQQLASLWKDGNPSLGTVLKVMKALGMRLSPQLAS